MRKKITKLLALALVGGAMSMAVACNQTPPKKTYFDVTLNGVTESVEKDGLLSEPMPLEDYESGGYLYVFEGWQYTDSEGETKLWDFDVDKVTGDVTLTPKFERREIVLNVTFKNGDTTISTTTVNKSSGKVTEPTIDKTYDDADANKRYTFQHWYVLNNGVEKRWNFAVDKVTEDNTVIYAKYSSVPLTVAVTINGTVVNVPYGGTVSKPETNPTKEPDLGYTYEFKFWMCNGNLYDFATVITEPIEIVPYFKKTERLYNIAIDLDNGTVINRENIPFGTTLSDFTPTTITKASTVDTVYTFSHFEDVNGEEVAEVNGSATYKAIYTPSVRKYDVTISVDGKNSVENVEYGSNLLTLLGAPTKAEDDDAIYTFSHWVDAENNVIVDTDTVKGEMTYTAVFDVEYKRYTITFDVYGNITTKKINVGEALADHLPTDTDRPTDTVLGKIYTFSHWVDSEGNTITGDTKVTDFETYTAIYDERDYNGTMSISDVVIATKDS
ncbi:MAG: InlB B-repeat-containing protein [Clostridia bacterium]|nr:InlB B-repeat-containing protein [Clostridia bacterium]